MPHVALVPFTGFRVREAEMLELGMALPGLQARAGAIAQLPALGLLTLAGLNPPEWTAIYHESGEADGEALAGQIIDLRPDLVAVSALTASVEEAYDFSSTGAVRGPEGCPGRTARDGLSGRVGASRQRRGRRRRRARLADRAGRRRARRAPPYLPRDLPVRPGRGADTAVRLAGAGARRRFTVQTQRGCPLACDFCAASRLLGPWREKPAAKVGAELAAVRAIEPRPVVELADDNTFAGRREIGPLLDALAGSGVRYFTECDWRIGEQPEVLAGLAASGCVQVLVGLESLDLRHVGMGPKGAPLARMIEAVEAIQATGVAVVGCFIVGGDGETEVSLDRLGEFLETAPMADVQLTLQTPFPGTAMHRRLRSQGRLLADRGWSHYTLFDVTYRPDAMSFEAPRVGFSVAGPACLLRRPGPPPRRHPSRHLGTAPGALAMRIATIPAFLVGNRRAILEIASDRGAMGVAALLVLSAALARNYDRASLLHEPWRLLGPFVASLAISGPLFLTIYAFARFKGMEGPGIGRAYRSFLTLYWMTAPMAWLYGIPYERFETPLEATSANLLTLCLVSIWRVALMTRVVSVIFGLRIRAALPLVMLVAEIAALTALHLVPLPILNLMGGIPEQQSIAMTALLVTFFCWVTLPLWVLMAAIATSSFRNQPEWRVPAPSEPPGRGRGALACAAMAVAGWAALLPFTQPEQRLAHRVDQTYRTAGPAAALALMSAHGRGDFPPDWQPPPRKFPGDPPTSEVLDTLEALADHPHADWLDDLYARRFRDRVEYDSYAWPEELMDQHAVRLAAILGRLREGPEMARSLEPHIKLRLYQDQDANRKDRRTAMETLLRLGGADQCPNLETIPPSSRHRETHLRDSRRRTMGCPGNHFGEHRFRGVGPPEGGTPTRDRSRPRWSSAFRRSGHDRPTA